MEQELRTVDYRRIESDKAIKYILSELSMPDNTKRLINVEPDFSHPSYTLQAFLKYWEIPLFEVFWDVHSVKDCLKMFFRHRIIARLLRL